MEKEELINLLDKHSSGSNIEDGWRKLSNDNNYWTYHHATIDTMEPQITLTTDGIVKYKCSGESKEFTYKEFAVKFILDTRRHYMNRQIRNDINNIDMALTIAIQNGLECEVVLWALKHIKENPISTIEEAIIAGMSEWHLL